ncbi:hypothetical protein [Streptomyces sp. NPDC001492]
MRRSRPCMEAGKAVIGICLDAQRVGESLGAAGGAQPEHGDRLSFP